MPRAFQVNIDAYAPERLAAFWAEALGYVIQPPPEGFESWEVFATEMGIPKEDFGNLAAVVDPDGVQPRLLFSKVPETKVVKNRVHLDINVTEPDMPLDDRREAVAVEVARMISLGATKIEERGDHTHTWTVMQDPEGNEFCIQ